ncbi:MAG: YqaJ viral recombinase family protein [Planctomycetota bacterium]|jgi:predicted phage-related endonuclease
MGSIPEGISGSRGAAILGLSQWATPVQVWLDIMEHRKPGFCVSHGFKVPDPVEGAPLRWGLAFEEAVIQLALEFTREEGIYQREHLYRHPENDFITCHIDGMYGSSFNSDYNQRILHEGKTTNIRSFREKWGEPGSDRIPQEYQIQTQLQMMCAEAHMNIVSVLVFPQMVDEWEKLDITPDIIDCNKWAVALAEMGYFHQYKINADPGLQEIMLITFKEWWEEYVMGETPPPAKTYDDIRRLVIAPKGTIVATENVARMSAEYKQINDELSRLKKRKDQLKTMICSHMSEQSDVPIDDDSQEKWILRDSVGRKLHSYSGKQFR